MLYQLVFSVPILALGALAVRRADHRDAVGGGARRARLPDHLGGRASPSWSGSRWCMRYSASRLSAFTFLTPLFGVAAGHLVLGEPMTPAFAAAVALVAGGLVLVNRPRDSGASTAYIGRRQPRGDMMSAAAPQARRRSVAVDVGGVIVGGGAPIVVQSMTNTDTADIEATARQVAALARAGSEMVRITVDRDEAAAAVPHIKERLAQMGVTCRSSATSITSATSCWPIIRAAPRRSTNTASIPAMSASRTSGTRSSRRSSRWRSSTASRCASAPIGARSTRSC